MTDSSRKPKFSERKGIVTPSRVIQVGGMSESLRTSLWNALHIEVWEYPGFLHEYSNAKILAFSESLWFEHFKAPLDSRPGGAFEILKKIRHYFFSSQWYEVYDLMEWIVDWCTENGPHTRLPQLTNEVLEREFAGYRLVEGKFIEITDPQEIEALEEALEDSSFPGVRGHLKSALRMMTDRDSPDYRNSIKESVSAVESMAKVVTGQPKASLGDALTELEKRGRLHSALRKGFSSLYGYTSDEGGIRHAMLEEPDLSAADAKYFLLSCTSLINYLKAKL